MYTQMKSRKTLFRKAVSVLIVLCMMMSVMLPLTAVTASAAAPTSYTTIRADSTASVSITSSGGAKYFKFVPTQSGIYKFYSTNYTGDPYGALLDASGSTLISDDDDGTYNFSFTYECIANTTYYVKAYMYGSSTGSYTLNVQTVSVVTPTPTPTPGGSVVDINTVGGTNYPLFNSGRTESSGYDADCNSTNPAPDTYNNSGYDLYGDIDDLDRFRLGLSFTMNIDVSEQSSLSIYAWDVDESVAACGHGYEHDYIYLVDETTGVPVKLDTHLSGQNDTWNTSIINISPDLFTTGHTYHFELQMTCTGSNSCSYYAITVRTVNIIVNGASEPPIVPTTGIENADLSVSISSSGLVSVDLTANAYAAETYTLEYKAVCAANNAQYGGKEYSVTIPTTSTEFDTTFQLESGAPRGTYEITVFIKDATGTVITTRTATASYGYSAVSYNANGGSQNLPADGTTYSSGDTVTVKFDYVPSMYGYTFLGWSTDRNATEPMYTENGTKTFTIGASDVTLYAVWALDVCEHEWSETTHTDATCTTDGLIVNTCSLCGDTQESEIPALGHNYVSGVCTRCGAAEHSADVWDGSIDTSWYNSTDTEFTIYTAEQLAGLAQLVNNGNTFSGKTIYLGNNIDLDNREWTPIGACSYINVSTGEPNLYFSGELNGNGYSVSNVKFSKQDYISIGLFGTCLNAEISSLNIENASFAFSSAQEDGLYCGILSGYIVNTTISNSNVIGIITMNSCSAQFSHVGGITGSITNGSTIERVCADVNISVTGGEYVRIGGIAGFCTYDTVVLSQCYTKGSLYGKSDSNYSLVGGLFGEARSSEVSNCVSEMSIEADGSWRILAGGLFGESNHTTITNCYFNGNITVPNRITGSDHNGVACAGGIVGEILSNTIINNCFAVGTVSGYNYSGIASLYDYYVSTNTITNCYYNAFLSGTNVTSATSTNKDNFKSQAWVESNLGWDFDTVWEFRAGSDYPVLQGFDDPTPPPPHTHDFEETSRTEPGCTTYGELVYTCSCGETRSELIEPTQHNYQITDTVEPTCTTDGYIEFACQNTGCGTTKRQTLERLGHNYGADNICDRCGHTIEVHTHDYVATVVEPTCTTMGYTEYTCSSCGHSYRDNYVEPVRHDWDDGVITVTATCTTDGVMTYTCGSCFATKTTVIEAGHQWSETVTVEKTCTTDGSKTKTCAACGTVEAEIIPAGHNWDNGIETLAATCKTEGSKTCTCLDCGDTQVFAIPALGHIYVNGVCTRCGTKFIDDVTPSTHPIYGMYFEIDDILSDYGPSLIDEYGLLLDYNSDANLEKVAVYLTQDGTMWRRCIAVKGTNIRYATYVPYLSYESDIKYTGLNHDWINIFRLSENDKGVWCYSDFATIGVNLEDAYGNLLLSLYDIGQAGAETRIFDDLDEMKAWLYDECIEHNSSDWIIDIPASCVPGSQHKECTVCEEILESEVIPPVADHISSEWVVDVAPTSTQTGSRHKECTVCGAVLETEVMPILAKLVIENVEAEAGKTVRVTIDIQNNPGIIGALLTIEYDPALTLISAEAGNAWNSLYFTAPNTFSNPCNFVWDGVSGADHSNGSIIVLTFEIPSGVDAGTVYNISASYTYGNMINENLEAVDLEIENGSITIINLVGDVNDDGVVDVADVIVLRRYLAGGYEVVIDEFAADMDNDGYITVADVVLLRRFLVN